MAVHAKDADTFASRMQARCDHLADPHSVGVRAKDALLSHFARPGAIIPPDLHCGGRYAKDAMPSHPQCKPVRSSSGSAHSVGVHGGRLADTFPGPVRSSPPDLRFWWASAQCPHPPGQPGATTLPDLHIRWASAGGRIAFAASQPVRLSQYTEHPLTDPR